MIELWKNIIRRTGLTSDNLFINSSESSMRLEWKLLRKNNSSLDSFSSNAHYRKFAL